MIRLFSPCIGVWIAMTSLSIASDVPTQLLGKTINLSLTLVIPTKLESGRVISTQRSVTQVIYISSAGRVFARISQHAKTGVSEADVEPSAGTAAKWHFAGGALISERASVSGARLSRISFDPSFQNCTYSAISGREGGKAYKWRGLNGAIYEAAGPLQVAQQACSILSGNGLAQ